MFQALFLRLIFSYLASALVAAEGKINWDAIQASLDAKLKAILPDWIEDQALILLDNAIYLVKKVVKHEGVFENLLKLVAAKDFSGVVGYLQKLVMDELSHGSMVAVSDENLVEHIQSYKQAA